MQVDKLTVHTKNSSGVAISGEVLFSDGKEWKWFRATEGKTLHFNIDSGVPSQWGLGNYGRTIEPPKRVAALKTALAEIGQNDFN